MKIIRYIRRRLQRKARANVQDVRRARVRHSVYEKFSGNPAEITRAQWAESIENPTAFYLRCCHYFAAGLPEELREHRQYFGQKGRGFGEDAFHTMWYLLFQEFRPASFLEIGVFRGQTLSLAALLARQTGQQCFVQGISPFSAAGDGVSRYRQRHNYQADTLENFARFSLPRPALLKAYSTDAAARQLIASRTWDIIYIDGNHDYEVARQDWEICSRQVLPGGLIVLDDAGLTTRYKAPPFFSTAGHAGPSRLAQEINRSHFAEILQVGHNRVFQKISV
ncbi:MAG TPA: class I SAM-dependent methyltransferase [Verrucomicrobiae bacterium]|nr:class I SAM-dependent methyltransferase [Verrucomicrobiae bacterium]